MFWNRHITIVFAVFFLVGATNCRAIQPTSSKEEYNRFREISGQYMPMTVDDHWYVITGLEKLLREYPNTFLRGDISMSLLQHYSEVTDDETLLTELAENMFTLRDHDNSSYQLAARVFVEKGIRSDKTLFFAQKAVAGAREKYEKWGDYERSVLISQMLLARAYQLAGQHQKAVLEVKKVVKGWQLLDDADLTVVDRQASVDRAQLSLLKIYVAEKAWHKSYALACDLLQRSVVRDDVAKLWGEAYVGRFGSVKGMATAYAKLNDDWEGQVAKRVEQERILKPAPKMEVEKLNGDMIRLVDLKGKPVVVMLWSSRCGPCIESMAHLSRLQARFRKVEFLVVNVDEDTPLRRGWVYNSQSKRGLLWDIALGDAELPKAFGSENIPYTCVIDADGNIRYEHKILGNDLGAAISHQLDWLLTEGKK